MHDTCIANQTSLRPALASDSAGICALWNPIIRDTFVTFNSIEKSEADVAAMIAQKQADGHGFWVAVNAQGVVGFATYGQFRGGVGYAHAMEHTIALHASIYGRGVGRGLIKTLEDHARSQGVHCMIAGVSAVNQAGVAFHAALGYATIATVPEVGRKAGRWLDLILMQKLL